MAAAAPGAPLVELRGVARTYPADVPVEALKPTSVSIARGEYVAVVGRSGSGKSTLLNVLGLLDAPTTGTYRFAGVDTRGLTEAGRAGLRAAAIGFVFQSFHLLARRTAVQNVALGLQYLGTPARVALERAGEALRAVDLAHRGDAVAATLSGGEQQRVAIARALVSRPALLLCDEPTGSLDAATGRAILDIFAGLHRDGATVVVITHDEDLTRTASRVLRIDDGVVRDSR